MTQVKAKANKTLMVQASPKIFTYDCQNIFIIQTTGLSISKFFGAYLLTLFCKQDILSTVRKYC